MHKSLLKETKTLSAYKSFYALCKQDLNNKRTVNNDRFFKIILPFKESRVSNQSILGGHFSTKHSTTFVDAGRKTLSFSCVLLCNWLRLNFCRSRMLMVLQSHVFSMPRSLVNFNLTRNNPG